MRLADHTRDVAAGLLSAACQLGVDSIHVSSEYESFPLVADLVSSWSAQPFMVMAKIGEPHFGEDRFDPARFTKKVETYLRRLSLERIDVVQWLLRYDLKDEAGRLRIFGRDAELISHTFAALRASGKVGDFISFPYTVAMSQSILASGLGDGFAFYINRLELDMAALLDEVSLAGKWVVAIRPYAAGRTTTAGDAETSGQPGPVGFALAHPVVRTAVASFGSIEHLAEAVEESRSAPSTPRFNRMVEMARGSACT